MGIKTFFSNLFYKGDHRKGSTPVPYKSRYDTASSATVTPVAFTPATNVNVVSETVPVEAAELYPSKVVDASTIPAEVTGTDPESVGVTAVPDSAVPVWPTGPQQPAVNQKSSGLGWPEKMETEPAVVTTTPTVIEPVQVVTPAAEPTVADAVVVEDTTEKDDSSNVTNP